LLLIFVRDIFVAGSCKRLWALLSFWHDVLCVILLENKIHILAAGRLPKRTPARPTSVLAARQKSSSETPLRDTTRAAKGKFLTAYLQISATNERGMWTMCNYIDDIEWPLKVISAI